MRNVENAITRIVTKYPFFAPGILKLKLIEDNSIPTIATNGVKLKVNTDFFATLKQREQNFAVLHEWAHIMFFHTTRKGVREYKRWNIACDFEANTWLKTIPTVELIQGALFEKQFAKMAAEQIYDLLPDEKSPAFEQLQNSQFGDVEPHPDSEGPNGQPEQGKIQEIEATVKQEIAAGLQIAKMQGKLPAEMARLLAALIEPQVDWRSEIINFTQQTSKEDYTFKRPNRRFLSNGFVLPTLHSEELGTLVFAGDTSGSVSPKEIDEYTADMIHAFGTIPLRELLVIWCDSYIPHDGIQSFMKGDDIILKPVGGGGTDFRPPFRYVEDNDIEVAGMIYLTDGECSRFASEPDYPVLWVIYGGNKDFNPPYGRVININ